MQSLSHTEVLKKLPFFFILGRPRSGTTLLRTLFDAHPNAAVPLECAFIVNMAHKYGQVTKWDKQNLLEYFADLQTHIKFDTWNMDLEKLKNALLECEGDFSFQELCKVVYLEYKSVFPKEEILLIGDKNPVYATYTNKLLELFPEAKFIHLVRDPRDNIISLKNVDFEGPFSALLAYRWRHSAAKLFRIKKKFPEKFYTIRYEDLAREPQKYYAEMCNYLSLPYHNEVFDFYKKQDEALKQFNNEKVMKYHKSLLSPINVSKIDLWKTQLPEMDIRIAEYVCGKWTKIYGYERRFQNPGFKAVVKSLHWMAYGKLLYIVRDLIDVLPFRTKIWIKNRGPLLARTFVKFRNPDS